MSEIITPKQLIALAKACRKAGIVSFKGQGIEFTLGPNTVAEVANTALKQTPADLGPNEVESDELSAEALMFWSTGGQPDAQDNA